MQQQQNHQQQGEAQTQTQRLQRRLTINSENRTIARSFSDELMDIFRIDNSVSDLDQQVDNRSVQTSSSPHSGAKEHASNNANIGEPRLTATQWSSLPSRLASAKWKLF